MHNHSLTTEVILKFIAPLLADLPQLISFGIYNTSISTEAAIAITTSLHHSSCSNLKQLVLQNIYLVENKATEFFMSLGQLTSLEQLDLLGSGIGPHRMQSFSILAMAKLKQLKSLGLQATAVQEKGALHVANQIANLRSLKMLNLGHNGIKDAGIIAIAKQLEYLTQLEELDLQSNSFTAVGAKDLLQSLQISKSVKKINLSKVKAVIEDEQLLSQFKLLIKCVLY